jgi:hypothetical protein
MRPADRGSFLEPREHPTKPFMWLHCRAAVMAARRLVISNGVTTMDRQELKNDEAQIVVYNDFYHVYRQDGFYCKEVWTCATEHNALNFCKENGWKVVR